MREIIHQQQPTSLTCMSTCLAMLLNVPVQDVIDEFHDDYINGLNVEDYLSIKKHIKAIPLLSTHRYMNDGKLYLIATPSLNQEAHTHAIICDCRDPEDFKIFDPCKGRKGLKYYVWKPSSELGELEVNLLSYFFDYEIEGL